MEDEDFVRALRAGDDAARSRLYEEHRPRLMRKATYLLGYNDPEVQDAVQETFLAAFKGISGFEGRSNLATWLNHICANLCFARMRARRRRVEAQQEEIERMLAPLAEEQMRRSEEEATAQERLSRMQALMQGIDRSCREVLELRYKQGLAFTEIKERLKLPLGTVASRLARCQDMLREKAKRTAAHA